MVVLMAGGCAPPPAPPHNLPRTVAVLPPHNETGGPLPVAGSSLLERYAFDTRPVTVPDVLASEAAADIAKRAHLDGAALFIDLRRWNPDPPTEPRVVIVDLVVSLIDPSSARTLWTNHWSTRPVRTLGEATLGASDISAARAVMGAVLAPLGPEH